MKTSAAAKTSSLHHFRHDLRRDWDSWSLWEQRAAATLGVSSSIFALCWLALSLKVWG